MVGSRELEGRPPQCRTSRGPNQSKKNTVEGEKRKNEVLEKHSKAKSFKGKGGAV